MSSSPHLETETPETPPREATDDARRSGPDPVAHAHAALRAGLRTFIARRVAPGHVDDLLQDVFVRMQEHRGDLRDHERVVAWAFRIARGIVADHHRARRDTIGVPDELPAEPREVDVGAIVAGWLRPMLAFLPPEYAHALELVELEGMSQKEYATRVGLSISGAKSRVQRARKMLEGVVRACCILEQDACGNVIGFTRRYDGSDESSGAR